MKLAIPGARTAPRARATLQNRGGALNISGDFSRTPGAAGAPKNTRFRFKPIYFTCFYIVVLVVTTRSQQASRCKPVSQVNTLCVCQASGRF